MKLVLRQGNHYASDDYDLVAIDGVIDHLMVQSMAEKLDLPSESIESRLIALSVDSALVQVKVLAAIGRKASLVDPLTSTILTIDETRELVDRMFKSEKAYLKGFK